MKYLFDCTFIQPEIRYKGIPTYAFRLLQALPNDIVDECSVLVRSSMVSYFKEQFPKLQIIVTMYDFLGGRVPKVGSFINYWLYRYRISHLGYECILIMDEFRRCNLLNVKKRKIAVIHDLKGIKDPIWGKKRYGYYERMIKTCDSIIAISEYTKQDILKYYHIDEHKVKVVYNSVNLPYKSSKPSSFVIDRNFILFVNTLKPYKNAITLVKAFNEIKDRYNLNMVFVGSSTEYWENEVMKYARDNSFDKRILRLENITPEELKYLYENATIFVTTSLHEGFGYTPIEAAMCKCPVISSTCEALQETTCNLLYYYEPAQEANALKDKMVEVLENPPSSEELTDIAMKLTSLYKPEKQALEMLRVMSPC